MLHMKMWNMLELSRMMVVRNVSEKDRNISRIRGVWEASPCDVLVDDAYGAAKCSSRVVACDSRSKVATRSQLPTMPGKIR